MQSVPNITKDAEFITFSVAFTHVLDSKDTKQTPVGIILELSY